MSQRYLRGVKLRGVLVKFGNFVFFEHFSIQIALSEKQ